MRVIASLLAVAFVSGCATGSVRMLGGETTYRSGACEVVIYHSKDSAIQGGLTKEVCIVEGSSAFSFDHSIDGAIKNNIGKVCQCGTNKAYVSSAHTESEMGIKGVSYVNLVGFK